jgi:hypothetical protein
VDTEDSLVWDNIPVAQPKKHRETSSNWDKKRYPLGSPWTADAVGPQWMTNGVKQLHESTD